MKNKQAQDLLEINKKQAEYYDNNTYVKNQGENLFVKQWGKYRKILHDLRSAVGIADTYMELHKKWVGDLSDKKVLDLGTGSGNYLSTYIAKRSREYHGIDLSQRLVKKYNDRLAKENAPNAKVYVADFISPEYTESGFDMIYAIGVAHHFENFEIFLDTCSRKLKPGGKIITYDPLNTYWITRIIRGLFRPFQKDSAWEWPFTGKNFELIRKYFSIEEVQGFFGQSKWAFPLSVFSRNMALKKGRKGHQADLNKANKVNDELFRCLHVTMLLTKPR